MYPWIHADVRHRGAYTWHRDPTGHVIVTETKTGWRLRPPRAYRWWGTHDRATVWALAYGRKAVSG